MIWLEPTSVCVVCAIASRRNMKRFNSYVFSNFSLRNPALLGQMSYSANRRKCRFKGQYFLMSKAPVRQSKTLLPIKKLRALSREAVCERHCLGNSVGYLPSSRCPRSAYQLLDYFNRKHGAPECLRPLRLCGPPLASKNRVKAY